MSAQYDLYETPDPANTGEQKPFACPYRSKRNLLEKKSFWNVCPVLPRLLIIML